MTTDKLDIWDTLLIRACKKNRRSLRMLKRIWSIRCGIRIDCVEKKFIVIHLLELIEKYKLASYTDLMFRADPTNWNDNFNMDKKCNSYSYYNHLLNIYCSTLRFTFIDKLPGFVSPSRFNKKS